MPDYYEILGVKRDATHGEIKKAYYKLAREFHTDKLHKEVKALDKLEREKKNRTLLQSEENERAQLKEKLTKFKEISAAYTVLSDQTKKSQYDRGEDPNQQTFETEPTWEEESDFYKKISKILKDMSDLHESTSEINVILRQSRILDEITDTYHQKVKEIKKQKNGIDKTEEINELEKRLSYFSTCIKLAKEIKSGNFKYCSSIMKEAIIATDDITSLAQIAVAYDHVEIFKLLDGEGTKVSLNSYLGITAKCCSEKILDFLFNKYINEMDVRYKDEEGKTALHHALKWLDRNESKYQILVESLLSNGARLDVKSDKGETPFDLLLNYAEKSFCPQAQIKRLNNVSALLSCCKIDELKKLQGTSALNKLVKLAASKHHKEIFNLLTKNNIHIAYLGDEDGNTALHCILKSIHYKDYEWTNFAKFLLSKGARLGVKNREGETPFDLLVDYVRMHFYDRHSSERNADGTYDFICRDSRSPLQRLDLVVRLLSEHKDKLEDLNGTSKLGTLVNIVVDCNHKGALDLLLESNIKISSITLENIVTSNCNKKIFDCFLHKNKIDYQDESGDTALHHALRKLHSDKSMLCKVESLVSAGARFYVKNDQGETPFDLLVEYVEKGFYGQASRLSYAWKLLNKCENKDVLRELKYKDGTTALDKLNELRIKCRNTSIIVASTLAVVGVALEVAIAVYSGMLALGIGIGVCCLVVAAIIYHCNSPANLLKDSNAEVAINQMALVKL
ncbi:TomO hydrophobic C-terminal domain-containing protein [Wolbachia endosymbiont (group B) of Eupithecia inturbata]|uniref:TomO hydrophobic C-terminal domain-containing protein n=1 Tax=Wolbachia endosymbiont (group B) of Eupithecia inturbata TaxID=3139316 RepID=UPI003CCAA261